MPLDQAAIECQRKNKDWHSVASCGAVGDASLAPSGGLLGWGPSMLLPGISTPRRQTPGNCYLHLSFVRSLGPLASRLLPPALRARRRPSGAGRDLSAAARRRAPRAPWPGGRAPVLQAEGRRLEPRCMMKNKTNRSESSV